MYSSFFSKFNIDIDVSRTWNWSASPSDEMERKYFYLSRLFTVERVFLCNIWGHYFIVLIICLFCNFSLKFTSILSIHPSHSCTSHHYVVGTLSHIKWVSSEYATSLKIVHQCWLVGCNLWLNDKKRHVFGLKYGTPCQKWRFCIMFLRPLWGKNLTVNSRAQRLEAIRPWSHTH